MTSTKKKTAEQIIEERKVKHAEAQKKYYNKKKDEINAKRKEVYALGTGKLNMAQPEPEPEPIPQPVPDEPTVRKSGRNKVVVIERRDGKLKKITYVLPKSTKIKIISTDEVQDLLKTCEEASEHTRITNLTSFTNLTKVTGKQSNLVQYLIDNQEKVIDGILNLTYVKKQKTEPYSINALKNVMNIILKINTKFNLNLPKEVETVYKDEWQILGLKSEEISKNKQETESIPSWERYFKEVEEKYGLDKLYIIGKFAQEITVRDNYSLKIVSNMNQTTDLSNNYLVVPKKSSNLTAVFHDYKTDNKYGTETRTLSPNLSEIIREYIKEHKLKNNTFLFGTAKITDFVSKAHRDMDYKGGGTNLYRKMSKSTSFATEEGKKPEVIHALAKSMLHSAGTSKSYIRPILED